MHFMHVCTYTDLQEELELPKSFTKVWGGQAGASLDLHEGRLLILGSPHDLCEGPRKAPALPQMFLKVRDIPTHLQVQGPSLGA